MPSADVLAQLIALSNSNQEEDQSKKKKKGRPAVKTTLPTPVTEESIFEGSGQYGTSGLGTLSVMCKSRYRGKIFTVK